MAGALAVASKELDFVTFDLPPTRSFSAGRK